MRLGTIVIMTEKAFTRATDVVDGAHPTRSVLRLLLRRPGRMTVAILAFALKEIPLWFLPVVTAAIIDIVAEGGEVSAVLGWLAVAVVLLLQNYPNHILYTRSFMTVVRDTGADLRNALAARLQSLSIGYHTRVSASLVQSKVVRDVENVELMLQQVTHPLLSSFMVLIGAIAMTAIAVPAFLPVYALAVPIAIGLRASLRRRTEARNAVFRREMEGLAARVGEMASLIPVTRAHGLEQTAVTRVPPAPTASARRACISTCSTGTSPRSRGSRCSCWESGCLVLAAVFSLTGFLPITPGEVVLLSTYFALLTRASRAAHADSGRGARHRVGALDRGGAAGARPRAERGQAPGRPRRGRSRSSASTHRYPDAEDDALHDVDLDIRPGRDRRIRRLVGLGQVDAAEPRARVRPSDGGRILLDGADMQQLDLRTVRRSVSVVPQESVLFEGTIRENVAYGLPHASDERGPSAHCGDANALEFVDARRDGMGHRGGRARRTALGWPAPATRHRPRARARSAHPAARRGDERARPGVRGAREGRARPAHEGTHDPRRRAPALDHPPGRPHRRARAGRIVEQGSHDELLRAERPLRDTAPTQVG